MKFNDLAKVPKWAVRQPKEQTIHEQRGAIGRLLGSAGRIQRPSHHEAAEAVAEALESEPWDPSSGKARWVTYHLQIQSSERDLNKLDKAIFTEMSLQHSPDNVILIRLEQ